MQRWLTLGLALAVGSMAHAETPSPKSPVRVETRYQNSPGTAEYPGAKAVILEDFIGFEAETDGSTVFTEHDVVKVLTQAGVEEHNDVIRLYKAGAEEVEVTHAREVDPDGSVVDIPKESVVDAPVVDHKLYKGYHKVVVHYPKVVPGSVVEYEITTRKKPVADHQWWATTYVQNPDPMVISTFTVKVPTGTDLHWAAPGLGSLAPTRSTEGGKDRYYWAVKNSPAQPTEADAPSALDTMHRIEVSSFANWPAVSAWFYQGWQSRVQSSEKVSVATAGLLPNGASPRQKAEAVLSWLGKNKNTVDIPVEEQLPNTPAELMDETTLSNLDTAALAASMLTFAGLDVKPVLAFTTPVEATQEGVPRPNRAEGVLLSVRSGDQQWWVDPEHVEELLSQPPSGYQGASALLCGTASGLVPLPASSADDNRQETRVEAFVSEDGKAEVLINLTETGASGVLWREAGRELGAAQRELREQTLDRIFTRMARAFSPRARVHDHFFPTAGKPGEPFEMSTTLIVPGYASSEGGPPTSALNLTAPLPVQPNEKLASLASESNRTLPIRFTHPFREETRVHVVFPQGSKVIGVPAPMEIETPYGSFFATARVSGSEMFYYSRLVVNTTWIPADKSSAFLAMARGMVSSHGSPISFTVPATPAQNDGKAKSEPGAQD